MINTLLEKFKVSKSLQVMLQAEAAECGLVCLGMIAAYHGQRRDLASLRRQFDTSLKGLSLKNVMEIADTIGLSSRPVRVELEALQQLKVPCLLHWNMNHFVVLEQVRGQNVTIVDPSKGRETLHINCISPHFTGVALELTPAPQFEKINDLRSVRISDFWQRISGLKRSLLQMLVLAGLLQVFSLILPLSSQLIVDRAIGNSDLDLLNIIVLAFSILIVVQAVTEMVREYVQLHLSTTLTFQMRSNLFHHLLRLPTSYFEKRHIGGIVERFGSLGPIEQLLTTTLVTALLDGLMAITTVFVIFIYSWQLSIVVVIILLFNLAGSIGIFPLSKRLTERAIEASGVEQTTFLEIIRAVSTIKTFGRESEREAVWKNKLADAINQNVRNMRVAIWMGFGNGLLFGLGNVIVLFLGARLVIQGELTIGMLMAFQIYQGQFISKAQALIANLFQLRMLGLHLERLADIVHAQIEDQQPPQPDAKPLLLGGKIELQNVVFRYADTEPYVLKGVDLSVDVGECLAIRGASGSGKSTLLKILVGLIKPTSGTILYDGQMAETLDYRELRRQIGVVSQDDTLLSGTLADNISFFDPDVDLDWVKECARSAMIDTDIQLMPMRYDTLIGDMGNVLSGGQRQRVILARAFYNRPKLLILDEATAHIDPETTKQILYGLGMRDVTRIVVSHDDLDAIEADRELWMDGGRLVTERRTVKVGEHGYAIISG